MEIIPGIHTISFKGNVHSNVLNKDFQVAISKTFSVKANNVPETNMT
jgi:hypothetical protein